MCFFKVMRTSTTPARILDYLQQNPYATLADIMAALGIAKRTAQEHIARLLREKQIHVAGYEVRFHGSGSPPRQFLCGTGVNRTRPKLSLAQKRIHHAKWKRDRKLKPVSNWLFGSPKQ